MLKGTVALIGLGAIGTPIAHKLYRSCGKRFVLLATGERRERLQSSDITINGEQFIPRVISSDKETEEAVRLLIVCVKNYQLEGAMEDMNCVVNPETIILPLQNGISSYELLRKRYPENTVLQGFVQGPNTRRVPCGFEYTNPGTMHIGDQEQTVLDVAADVYAFLEAAGVDVHLEQDIRRSVWKKWMLNVAGNSVTALTDADYKHFKDSPELQSVCSSAMKEFIKIAGAEGIPLTEGDISDVLTYYRTYNGSKRTSMLEDVSNRRRTENEYLAGKVLDLAKQHDISIPVIESLYLLIKIKEEIYSRTAFDQEEG